MINIPPTLKKRGIRFVLLEKGCKKPFQMGWQNKNIEYDSTEFINHLVNNGNYGVMGGGNVEDVPGDGVGLKKLLLVDFDNAAIQEECMKKLPDTFTVRTGSGMLHLYFFSNDGESFKIFDEELNTLADIQGEGKQVVGPGSIHPNGIPYTVEKDIGIAFIDYAELKAILMPFDKKPNKKTAAKEHPETHHHKDSDDQLLNDLKSRIKPVDVLRWMNIDTSINPTKCFKHESKGGKCMGFNDETAHCFHCDGSWNIFSLIMEYKKCLFKEALVYLADIGGMQKELEESKQRFIAKKNAEANTEKSILMQKYLMCINAKNKDWAMASELIIDYITKHTKMHTTKDDEKSEMWIYKDGIYIPQGKSEIKEIMRNLLDEHFSTFIYNAVLTKLEPDTYIDRDKFFQMHYSYKDEIPVENGILNINTLELSEFNPKRVFFNKIPVKYDPKATCPKIDKFFKDVLTNEDDVHVLYELAGFSFLKDYKFEKAFMLVGNGRNGKGKSIELLKRLVGIENCCSASLVSLVPESFTISELFGKMLNLAGDIGNTDLKDTSMFKSLTGRDLVGGKRKFLKNINFENYAKFVFACNELPMVYDLSRGFWDRWILLEFPYTFVTKEEYDISADKTLLKIKDDDIINKITTPEEMSGLLNEALKGLKRLLEKKRFSSSKGTEEVKSTWIRKSNSFVAFCYDFIEDASDGKIPKKDLRKKYADYCKAHNVSNKSDFVIKKALMDMYGVGEDRINQVGDYWEWFWTGIRWKENV